jgi:hypothetical protein
MQMRIVSVKEFQELLDSTHILVGTDSEVYNGKEKEVMVELHQDKSLISRPNLETLIARLQIRCLICKNRGHKAKNCPEPKVICFKCR